jgi:DNA-binding PadR family transcriptional regulator
MTISNNAIDVRPRNWLAPVALAMLREESSHGYEPMDRIAEFLLQRRWTACRVYSVTDAGEGYLEDWAEGCKKYQLVLDAFFLAHTCR